MALSVPIPTRYGADATFWRAVDWRLNTENPQRPFCEIEWAGYASPAAYLDPDGEPLFRRRQIIPAEDVVAMLAGMQAEYAAIATATELWVRENLGWTEEPDPDHDPDDPDSSPTRAVPGPWADAAIV